MHQTSMKLIHKSKLQCLFLFYLQKTVMEYHARQLQKLCRLCRQVIKADKNRTPCSKAKYSRVLSDTLKIDVDNEDASIYPQFLCRACDMKTDRYRKTKSKSKKLNIDPAQFTPHQPDCSICGDEPIHASILQACEDLGRSSGFLQSNHCDRTLYITVRPSGTSGVKVVKCITIFPDLEWSISVFGHEVSVKDVGINQVLTLEDAETLFNFSAERSVCKGVPDMVEEATSRNLLSACVEEVGEFTYGDVTYTKTLRHNRCKLLISEEVCGPCKTYRSDIISMRRNDKKDRVKATSHAKLTSLSREELIERCKSLQEERRELTRKNLAMKKHMEQLIDSEGVTLTETQSEIMLQCVNDLEGMLQEDTPEKLLWEEQLKAIKSNKNMRWHPAIIRWCIAIQSKSSSAYRVLREAGFLRLPHESTLKKYTHYTDAAVGIQYDVLETMINEIDFGKPHNANVTLILDEMKIKSGLVFSSSSGELIGFTDVGEVNNEINEFARRIKMKDGELAEQQLASHAFTIMVRGLFQNFQQPIAFYPTCALNNSDIYETVWHAVSVVEARGLKVRCLVADGAQSNRKFYKSSAAPDCDIPFWTINPYDKSRKIYFFCDVPHLLKTTRNNLENSGYGRKSRNLRVSVVLVYYYIQIPIE